MSDELTMEQLRQIVTDAAAGHPNVVVAEPGQHPQVEALFASMFAGVEVIAAVGEAARDCMQARPEAEPHRIAAMMLRDGDFLGAWNDRLDDRARTELMCVYAAAAVDAKVPIGSIPRDQLYQIYARDLLELGYETAAIGVPLIPDPLNPQNTPLWCYAASTVCDSADPELAKIRAVCLLAALAAKAQSATTGPEPA